MAHGLCRRKHIVVTVYIVTVVALASGCAESEKARMERERALTELATTRAEADKTKKAAEKAVQELLQKAADAEETAQAAAERADHAEARAQQKWRHLESRKPHLPRPWPSKRPRKRNGEKTKESLMIEMQQLKTELEELNKESVDES